MRLGSVRKAMVLVNPVAGRGRARDLSELACRLLTRQGTRVERHETTAAGNATELAREASPEIDLIVVAGGDGSVRETLVGLGASARRVPIAVIPSGNANVVARELAIPLAGEAAVELLAHGSPTPIDVGFFDSELFLAMVGVGYDARVTRNLARIRATRIGRAWYRAWADSAYAASGLAALAAWPPDRLRIEVDAQPVHGRYCAAVVANFATYGKGWSLVPHSRFADGRLGYQARKRFGFPFVAWQLVAGRLRRRVPAFISDYGSGLRISITSERPVPVHIDGDFRGWHRSLELTVRPGAAQIIAPMEPSQVEELRKVSGL